MAIIKKAVFQPSGTYGDAVFRIRNGKTVMYRRPVKQNVSRSAGAESARFKFGVNTKFAVNVNSLPYLKHAWKKAKVKGSNHFQKIIKYNAYVIKRHGISTYNMITPAGIYLPKCTAALSENNIIIKYQSPDESLIGLLSNPYIFHIIFFLSSPKRKSTDLFSFTEMVNEIRNLPEDNLPDFTFSLDETTRSLIKKYNEVIIYTAIVSAEQLNKKIFWTTTSSTELK